MGHGGKREGSGRKCEGDAPKVVVTGYVSQKTKTKMMKRLKVTGAKTLGKMFDKDYGE